MFDVMNEVVRNDNMYVTGYCVVPIPKSKKASLVSQFGIEYEKARHYLVVIHTVISMDCNDCDEYTEEEIVNVWICDAHWRSFENSPWIEIPGTHEDFARTIIDINMDI